MSKAQEDLLRGIAQSLPDVFNISLLPVELVGGNPQAALRQIGNSHYSRLRVIFKIKGTTGVQEYCDKVHALYQQAWSTPQLSRWQRFKRWVKQLVKRLRGNKSQSTK